jgi:hypothetical protein
VGSCMIPGTLGDIFIKDYYVDTDTFTHAFVSRGNSGVSILEITDTVIYDEYTPTIDTNGDAKKIFVPTTGPYIDYAFVANGSNNGFVATDLSDLSNLDMIVFNDFPSNSSGQDIFVHESYVFLANGERGLDIIDIIDIHSPSIISTIETPGFVVGVYVNLGFAYIIDSEIGLYVINIDDINNPFIIGSYELESVPSSINFLGSYVYLTDNDGIKIIQVVD